MQAPECPIISADEVYLDSDEEMPDQNLNQSLQDEERFEGAFSGARPVQDNLLHVCNQPGCGRKCPFANAFAYLKSDGQFHVAKDPDFLAVQTGEVGDGVWRQADKEKVIYTCIWCCEEKHKKKYFNANGKPTSHFRNQSDLSRGKSTENKVTRALQTVEKHRNRKLDEESNRIPVHKIYETCKDVSLARATDWVQQIHPNILITYGCPKEAGGCGTYPLKSNKFYRLSRKDDRDGTVEKGFWACANCLRKWQWKTHGKFRLFVIMNPDNWDECVVAFIGHHGKKFHDTLNQELLVLKGARMLQKIGDTPITYATILNAIEALNEECARKLFRRVPIKRVTSADPKTKFTVPLYCEDQRLSLPSQGRSFYAMDIDDLNIPVLTKEEVEKLVAVSASLYNLADYPTNAGKATKKAAARLLARTSLSPIRNLVETAAAMSVSEAQSSRQGN
jgi:hypothetical protein